MKNEMDLIKRHEGFCNFAYECTAGKLTIGYGRNLDDVGITKDEAEVLLHNDLYECASDLKNNFQWFPYLSEQRMQALVDMRYNLGRAGFRRFKKMIKAFEQMDYATAAKEMLDSHWARQVGERALRLADIIENNVTAGEALKKTYRP